MKYGKTSSPPTMNTRKVILVKADPCHGFLTEIDPPEWFLVLTDPPPRRLVCSGETPGIAIKRAEDEGYSFEEDPSPFFDPNPPV